MRLLNKIKKFININRKVIVAFGKLGLRLRRESTCLSAETAIAEFYQYVLHHLPNKAVKTGIVSIVFSKNRAMQLHAFIRSFIKHVENRGDLYVLYKTTNELHEKSYQELAEIFKHEKIFFIEELNFRPQLIELCEHSCVDKVSFYVDDMIFLRSIDYFKINNISLRENLVSLGLGKDLIYAIYQKRHLRLPELEPKADGFLSFAWNAHQTPGNWTYPLGVSGNIFDRLEMCAMLNSISFIAPSSLELGLQCFSPIFLRRKGVCPEAVVCTGIHANIVQTEIDNYVIETHSTEDLLERWYGGQQIYIDFFHGQPISEVQLMSFEFERRAA